MKEMIKRLEILKALIEWDLSLEYQEDLTTAIERLEKYELITSLMSKNMPDTNKINRINQILEENCT